MRKLIIAVFVTIISMFGLAALSQPVEAGVCPPDSLNPNASTLAECNLPVPEGTDTDLSTILTNVINVVIGIVAFVAVIVMIIGGINFIVSQGDASKIAKAKNTVLYGVIGLIIALMSFAIVNFVLSAVGK